MGLLKGAGVVRVAFVSPGGPAGSAGFKGGDALVTIEGKSVAAWTDADIARLRFRGAGSSLVFTLQNGEVRKVRLADFY